MKSKHWNRCRRCNCVYLLLYPGTRYCDNQGIWLVSVVCCGGRRWRRRWRRSRRRQLLQGCHHLIFAGGCDKVQLNAHTHGILLHRHLNLIPNIVGCLRCWHNRRQRIWWSLYTGITIDLNKRGGRWWCNLWLCRIAIGWGRLTWSWRRPEYQQYYNYEKWWNIHTQALTMIYHQNHGCALQESFLKVNRSWLVDYSTYARGRPRPREMNQNMVISNLL